jgi:hypothetical protein
VLRTGDLRLVEGRIGCLPPKGFNAMGMPASIAGAKLIHVLSRWLNCDGQVDGHLVPTHFPDKQFDTAGMFF